MVVQAEAETFRADGGARAVLLCHGFTGSPAGLLPWARDLAAAGLTVRLPRLPGHGTSWTDMATTTWADWLACVAGELADLRSRGHRVVVGGLSMGGALALRLAADHPGDVDGLVLVNPAVLLQGAAVRAVPALVAAHRVLTRLRGGGRPLSAPGIGSDIAAPGVHESAYDRVPLAALASMLAGTAALRRDLARVRAPLVLLRSAIDHVVPAASSAAVLTGVSSPDVRLEVLARSFHVATLDHDAPRISAATLELVGRLAPAPTTAVPPVPSAREGAS